MQVAFQQADYVAWNLWASINQRPLLPFKYQHLGDMMSLGEQTMQFSPALQNQTSVRPGYHSSSSLASRYVCSLCCRPR